MSGKQSIGTILVYVGNSPDDAIGENILKLPFLNALCTAYPDARITWIAGVGPAQFEGILTNVIDGRIDEFLTDFRLSGDVRELTFRWRPMPGRRFDLIIDAQRNAAQSLVLRRIPHRIFISGCWRFFFSDRKPEQSLRHPPLLTDKLLGLAAAAVGETVRPSPVWPLRTEWIETAERILPDGETYLGLAPGAGKKGTGKCWPLENFLALARDQHEKARRPVFFLGPGEVDWVDRIRRLAPFALLPRESLDPDAQNEPALAMALARRLSVAVANCSGIGHLLAAGGPPMVSLFGPTRPSKYAPYASSLVALRAQDFGPSSDIAAIPLDAVIAAVDRQFDGCHAPTTAAPPDVRALP
jgi:ADP-heptose:LPS heptosyltransferase